MFANLENLKFLIKTKSYHIDYPLFRLHYQVTASLIFAYCLILSAQVLFGDPIYCRARGDKGADKFFDQLCYAQGTYTKYYIEVNDLMGALNESTCTPIDDTQRLPSNSSLEEAGQITSLLRAPLAASIRSTHKFLKHKHCFSSQVKYVYPGIPVPGGADGEYNRVQEYVLHHRYYQYIPVLLFIQAVLFYAPHYLWKMWENGIISSVCKELHDHRFQPLELIQTKLFMVDYIDNCLCRNKSLVYKYFFCQILLLVNLVGQIIWLDSIFNNHFITYGLDSLQFHFVDSDTYGLRGTDDRSEFSTHSELNNPANLLFPKATACTLEFLSQGGLKTDIRQYLCILPLNIFNDKFYLILWFWFLILMTVTLVQIIFDLVYLTVPILQRYLFDKKFGPYLSKEKRRRMSLSELFLLDLIGSNSQKYAFAALLKKIDSSATLKSADVPESHSLV